MEKDKFSVRKKKENNGGNIMRNALIISIFIIVLIVIGNILTQNYTKQVVEELSSELKQLRKELLIEDIDWGKSKEIINKIEENWHKKYQKMAYFIEHDELEKVETNLVGVKSYAETQEATEAVSELDKSIFVLKHIQDKDKLELKNIF